MIESLVIVFGIALLIGTGIAAMALVAGLAWLFDRAILWPLIDLSRRLRK